MLLAATAAGGELDVAKEALRDGLWEVARLHATNGVNSAEARLVFLEALAGEGRWAEVGPALVRWPDAQGPGFDYYRAVVKGDHAAAQAILKAGGSPEGIVEAKLHEAEALAKGGDKAAADEIWREVAAATNASERALALASANLMDAALLRTALSRARTAATRRLVGLRLGLVLLRDEASVKEGERLVRAVVKDSPDAPGAKEAFLALADAKLSASLWKEAVDAYREAVDIWPDAAKVAAVQEGRGWALQRLGRREEALEAFHRAAELATDAAAKATAILKEGDVLAELGRGAESTARYREVIEKYPQTTVAAKLKAVIRLREREDEGRRLFKEFRFGDALKVFEQVAEADSARRQRMNFYAVLCLYGQGRDDAAAAKARDLVATCPDPAVRADALMWLAKFLYNRREWKESGRLFAAYAESAEEKASAAEALLWAARAALAESDFNLAIQLSTRLAERYPDSPHRAGALLVQGEALVELARFDEAVLVFERVSLAREVGAGDRVRAQILKADALYAMGADNAARYTAALEAYRAVRFGGALSASGQLVVSFKIARTLDKLKRLDEAIDQYYSQVVVVYRSGRLRGERFSDEARAVFSRAAFRLVDEYEGRGQDAQALHVLDLVAASDVPAAEEAKRRIEKISNNGRFL